MRQLIRKIILPVTILSFFGFTKWWYVLPVDAPDSMMTGFPLIWLSEGWHTSLSLQIFVTELIIDFLVYFLFWLCIFYCINRFIVEIKIPKVLMLLSWVLSIVVLVMVVFIARMPEHIYKAKRDFEVEVLVTGYHFFWEAPERPKYEDYKSIGEEE